MSSMKQAAHALNKKVVLLTQDAADIPFDLKHYPHIVYGGSIADLKTELTRRVKWFLEQPQGTTTGLCENLRLYIDRQDLTLAPELIAIHSGGLYAWSPKLNVHNSEDSALRDECFRVGLISPDLFESMDRFQDIELPDNRRLHLLLEKYVIWPGGWEQIPFNLMTRGNLQRNKEYRWPMAFRLFLPGGTKDYPFFLNIKKLS